MRTVAIIPCARTIPTELLHAIEQVDEVLVVQDGGAAIPNSPSYRLLDEKLQAKTFGADLDLLGKGSAACRNFGTWYAYYHTDAQVFLNLDDDVVPLDDSFVYEHSSRVTSEAKLERVESSNAWVSTIWPEFPRGFPYEERLSHQQEVAASETTSPVLNMGVWTEDIDYNAVDKVVYSNTVPATVGARYFVRDRFIPICAMNFSVRREWAPICFQIPWIAFETTLQLKRMDDILGGLIFCAVAQATGNTVAFGGPAVLHRKRDTALLKHAHQENLGNVVISRAAYSLATAAARVANEKLSDPVRAARRLVDFWETGDSSRDLVAVVLDHCRSTFDRWLRWFEGG